MAATISVKFVDSQSEAPANLTLVAGTTYRQFFDSASVNLDNMTATAKLDGDRIDYDLDDEIEDGVRISVTPDQIKGA